MPNVLTKDAVKMLRRVAKLALDVPERMDMGEWCKKGEPGTTSPTLSKPFPSCGTVGCIGGWTEVLYKLYHPKSRRQAGNILGLTDEQEQELFYDGDLIWARKTQTKGHAQRVARHIERFIKKYGAST